MLLPVSYVSEEHITCLEELHMSFSCCAGCGTQIYIVFVVGCCMCSETVESLWNSYNCLFILLFRSQ